MRKAVQLFFVGLLLLPILLMTTAKTKEVYGKTLSDNFTVVKATGTLSSKEIKTNNANGILICWENVFETGRRFAGLTINGTAKNLILSAQQVSAIHTCMEAHTGKIAYDTKKRFGKNPTFERLPATIKVTAFPTDGSNLKIMTDDDGNLKVWLLKEEWFSERFFYHLTQLIERASQYKPISSFFGYAILLLWVTVTIATGFAIIRE